MSMAVNHLMSHRTLATTIPATLLVRIYSASQRVLALATPSLTRQTVWPGDPARQLPSFHASPWLMLLFDCHGNQNGTCRHSPGPVHHVPATTRSRRFIMACRHPWRTTGPYICFNKAPEGESKMKRQSSAVAERKGWEESDKQGKSRCLRDETMLKI